MTNDATNPVPMDLITVGYNSIVYNGYTPQAKLLRTRMKKHIVII